MKKLHSYILTIFLLFLSQTNSQTSAHQNQQQSTYIIHVIPSLQPSTSPTRLHWYSSTLRSLPQNIRRPIPRILYTYELVADAFAATLTANQAAALRLLPHILQVNPDTPHSPHITHTPSFLHLTPSSGLWSKPSLASSIVIAVLDTGIFHQSHSFNDPNLSSPPSTFKTSCHLKNFSNSSAPCSNKLVGAKFFYKGYEAHIGHPINEDLESKSPLDTAGHGTHTASTAAGSIVSDANFFGYAKGTAQGIATNARIAAYKICWVGGCFDSDILAAMDAAVEDGANIISLSVGPKGKARDYFRDAISIGSFGATRHGVVVSSSAGNSGPKYYTATNIAPWIITVGASTVDREFRADVQLGDGSVYKGASLYGGPDNETVSNVPLVFGREAGSAQCLYKELYPSSAKGKIVVCIRGGSADVQKGLAVKKAGGVGMIIVNYEERLLAQPHVIPATMVSLSSGRKIKDYINSVSSPNATILFKGTVIGKNPASPKVAVFSNRGPNSVTYEILKPDVIAPGVNILAAWTGYAGPTNFKNDNRRVDFNIISGTSMACPHVSGIAALLKETYPDWSPAAIKSAIMTTAYNNDNKGEIIKDIATGQESNPFVRGSGHVDPNKALDPGLVYDAGFEDYLGFLCSIYYTSQQISIFTREAKEVNCMERRWKSPGELNYPSFSVVFYFDRVSVSYQRKVKNVGGPGCGDSGCKVYNVEISSPPGVEVNVTPKRLVFDSINQQSLTYKITFTSTAGKLPPNSQKFGWICWRDGVHEVRSPIAFLWRDQYLVSSM